jgi:hypothetical protein
MRAKTLQKILLFVFIIFPMLITSLSCRQFAEDVWDLLGSLVQKENEEERDRDEERRYSEYATDVDDMDMPEEVATEIIQELTPGLDSGTGMVYFHSAYEPVQVNIEWENFIPECVRYQAHAESGVVFAFDYDLEALTFTGSAAGTAYAQESIWEAWGEFGVYDIEGTITRAENGHDYEFTGTGTLVLEVREQAKCAGNVGDPTITEKEDSISTTADISGKIWDAGDAWRWSPLIYYTDGTVSFSLKCINCDVSAETP